MNEPKQLPRMIPPDFDEMTRLRKQALRQHQQEQERKRAENRERIQKRLPPAP